MSRQQLLRTPQHAQSFGRRRLRCRWATCPISLSAELRRSPCPTPLRSAPSPPALPSSPPSWSLLLPASKVGVAMTSPDRSIVVAQQLLGKRSGSIQGARRNRGARLPSSEMHATPFIWLLYCGFFCVASIPASAVCVASSTSAPSSSTPAQLVPWLLAAPDSRSRHAPRLHSNNHQRWSDSAPERMMRRI